MSSGFDIRYGEEGIAEGAVLSFVTKCIQKHPNIKDDFEMDASSMGDSLLFTISKSVHVTNGFSSDIFDNLTLVKVFHGNNSVGTFRVTQHSQSPNRGVGMVTITYEPDLIPPSSCNDPRDRVNKFVLRALEVGCTPSHQRWHTLFLSVIKKIISLWLHPCCPFIDCHYYTAPITQTHSLKHANRCAVIQCTCNP